MLIFVLLKYFPFWHAEVVCRRFIDFPLMLCGKSWLLQCAGLILRQGDKKTKRISFLDSLLLLQITLFHGNP
ncbi:hypothetical protein X975_05795, partial [Stegodyphus mimosarum]